jgi:hypothetical protein
MVHAVPLHAKQAHRGNRVGIFIITLDPTRRQKVVGGQYHAPAAVPQGRRTGTDCTGSWVSLRASVNWSGKSHPPPGFETRIVIPIELSD